MESRASLRPCQPVNQRGSLLILALLRIVLRSRFKMRGPGQLDSKPTHLPIKLGPTKDLVYLKIEAVVITPDFCTNRVDTAKSPH
jgi:hypothetical protein